MSITVVSNSQPNIFSICVVSESGSDACFLRPGCVFLAFHRTRDILLEVRRDVSGARSSGWGLCLPGQGLGCV